MSKATKAAKVPYDDHVQADTPGFVIADARDNSAWSGAPTYTSHAKAKDALAAQISADPALAGSYHVIPAAEAKAAA